MLTIESYLEDSEMNIAKCRASNLDLHHEIHNLISSGNTSHATQVILSAEEVFKRIVIHHRLAAGMTTFATDATTQQCPPTTFRQVRTRETVSGMHGLLQKIKDQNAELAKNLDLYKITLPSSRRGGQPCLSLKNLTVSLDDILIDPRGEIQASAREQILRLSGRLAWRSTEFYKDFNSGTSDTLHIPEWVPSLHHQRSLRKDLPPASQAGPAIHGDRGDDLELDPI